MPPDKKRRVLTEEDYEQVLETIISRDFFPDVKRIRKVLKQNVPDTSDHLESHQEPPVEEEEQVKVSLDQFQATHVTEDDLDFEKILTSEKKARQDRLKWIQAESERHNRALKDTEQRLQQLQDSSQSVEGLLVGGTKWREIQQAAEGVGRLSNRHVPEPILMFPPSRPVDNFGRILPATEKPLAIVDDVPEPVADGQLAHRVEQDLSAIKPLVVHPNTRFSLAVQSALDDSKIGPIEATERERLLQLRDSREQAGGRAIESGNFDLTGLAGLNIERTPVVAPDDAPIMTWGEIGATPVVLAEDTAFTMQDQSARESIADSLRTRISGKARDNRRSVNALKDMAASLSRTPLTGGSIFGGVSAVRERDTATSAVLMTPLGKALAKNLGRKSL